ncbi:hypothetical protein A3Q56_01639 [Intoshia linei]|uniref:EF-hand domain-containing protein n=1 Tax=Intoshia linei TaxID=1819745 RepID=A0A177BAD2_9BILA|nr:hypothetical protein A3Q56_01639 [Intoshia linei]
MSSKKNIDNELTEERLKALQDIFQKSDSDKGGGLDIYEFRNAFKCAVSNTLTYQEIDEIFMKVDINCDGQVDWEEYITYMMLEFKERDNMQQHQNNVFSETFTNSEFPHKQKIAGIVYLYTKNESKVSKDCISSQISNFDYMVTISESGVLCVWMQKTLNLQGTLMLKQPDSKCTSHITDCHYIENSQIIAISTTRRQLLFVQYSSMGLRQLNTISMLPEMPYCITKGHDLHISNQNGLNVSKGNMYTLPGYYSIYVGDIYGKVISITFKTFVSQTRIFPNSNNLIQISFTQIKLGAIYGIKTSSICDFGITWMRGLRRLPTLQGLACCCKQNINSLLVIDINFINNLNYSNSQKNISTKNDNRAILVLNVHKGINVFQLCEKMNMIITGGYDGKLRIWNPTINKMPPLVIIEDFINCSILDMQITYDETLIFTLSDKNEIHVRSLHTQQLMQSLIVSFSKNSKIPKLEMGTLGIAKPNRTNNEYKTVLRSKKPKELLKIKNVQDGIHLIDYDNFHRVLSVCGKQLGVFKKLEAIHSLKTLDYPINCIVYNPLFNQIISGSSDGLICVWAFNTASLVMQFRGHYRTGKKALIRSSSEVTHLSLDKMWRRLISSGTDGYAKIWNFHNGNCLYKLVVSNQDFPLCTKFFTLDYVLLLYENSVYLHSLKNYEQLNNLSKHEPQKLNGPYDRVEMTCVASIGERIMCVGYRNSNLDVFRLNIMSGSKTSLIETYSLKQELNLKHETSVIGIHSFNLEDDKCEEIDDERSNLKNCTFFIIVTYQNGYIQCFSMCDNIFINKKFTSLWIYRPYPDGFDSLSQENINSLEEKQLENYNKIIKILQSRIIVSSNFNKKSKLLFTGTLDGYFQVYSVNVKPLYTHIKRLQFKTTSKKISMFDLNHNQKSQSARNKKLYNFKLHYETPDRNFIQSAINKNHEGVSKIDITNVNKYSNRLTETDADLDFYYVNLYHKFIKARKTRFKSKNKRFTQTKGYSPAYFGHEYIENDNLKILTITKAHVNSIDSIDFANDFCESEEKLEKNTDVSNDPVSDLKINDNMDLIVKSYQDCKKNPKYVITSSKDCSIRVWTINGLYVGIIGQPNQWNISRFHGQIKNLNVPNKEGNKFKFFKINKFILPTDIVPYIDATNIYSLSQGERRAWKKPRRLIAIISILRTLGLNRRVSLNDDKKSLKFKPLYRNFSLTTNSDQQKSEEEMFTEMIETNTILFDSYWKRIHDVEEKRKIRLQKLNVLQKFKQNFDINDNQIFKSIPLQKMKKVAVNFKIDIFSSNGNGTNGPYTK